MTSMLMTLPRLRNGEGLGRLLSALVALWRQGRRLRAARRYVMEMDSHMLADIGVSRAQAMFEIDQALHPGSRRRD